MRQIGPVSLLVKYNITQIIGIFNIQALQFFGITAVGTFAQLTQAVILLQAVTSLHTPILD